MAQSTQDLQTPPGAQFPLGEIRRISHVEIDHRDGGPRQRKFPALCCATIVVTCRPWHWRDRFSAANTPSPEVAGKAREIFGWLLDESMQG